MLPAITPNGQRMVKTMETKEQFNKKYLAMAEREADIINPKNREKYIQDWLENRYAETVEWHKKNDRRVFLESCTLEQLYVLNH